MNKLVLLICLIILLPSIGFAQPSRKAKILLVNGVKIKGGVVKSYDKEFIEVEMANMENILIRYDHIKRITFKNYGNVHSDFAEKIDTNPTLKTETFYHEFRGGLLIGEENASGTIHTINGYQFNQFLGTGLGVGLNKFGNYLTVPIYATVKGYIQDKKVSPFYYGDIGYGLAWHSNKNDDVFELDNVKGGLYWQLGLGYQINFYNSSLVLSLGYVNQGSQADYTYYRPWDLSDVEVTEKRLLRRFNLSVGFLF